MLLDSIQKTNDIHKIDPKDYEQLAAEIRAFLLQKVSKTGGHLASNLGAVELTMALHIAFDLPKDKIIFDVGHQCYTHKLLTGRREGFDTLRQFGGMSGFPKKEESDCDIFDTGHSSTSISMGLGLAQARDILGEDYSVVAVIGDGSLTGGMAYEALNNASSIKKNFIIVLNDNNMSISKNVGGMSKALQELRTAPRYTRMKKDVKNFLDSIPDVGGVMIRSISKVKNSVKQLVLPEMFFENMDLTYLGPIDGHDVGKMVDAFQDAKRLDGAVVVHVVTKKGKGYRPAEEDPERFHGIGSFDLQTGKSPASSGKSYTSYAADALIRLAKKDSRVVTMTAAMPSGTGLSKLNALYPERVIDVGIAEQHLVGFASGLAAGGMKPYVCIYSTFLQRAYDQLIHDICLQKSDVTFLIDRAGLVGADGETHQGMLDVGYLQTAPGMTVMAPGDGPELSAMLDYSLEHTGPLAIRYPRGNAPEGLIPSGEPIKYGKSQLLKAGTDVVLFAVGSMVSTALNVAEKLKNQGIDPTVVNARFIKPLDTELLETLSADHTLIAVMEENNRSGGTGQVIADLSCEKKLPWTVLNLEPSDAFIQQGSQNELRALLGLDAESVCRRIMEKIRG